MLDVEPITTCRMVDRLEQAGLVERRHDPNDRRAWQIFLTDAAMPLIDGMKDRASLLNTAALAGLTKSDQNNLVRMLDTIRQNLNGMVVDTKERSEEHTSELQSIMRISYTAFCLKNKKNNNRYATTYTQKTTNHQ